MISTLPLFLEIVALGLDVVGDERLDGGFGAAVGVCGANGADFRDGNHVLEAGGVSIDGGRGGEDDIGDIVLSRGGEKAYCAVDICAVVFERDLARFAYGLQLVN